MGSSLSGSVDSSFVWKRLDALPYEGAFLSSPGVRKDAHISLTVGAVYSGGQLDCGFAVLQDTRYQRPALHLIKNIYTF